MYHTPVEPARGAPPHPRAIRDHREITASSQPEISGQRAADRGNARSAVGRAGARPRVDRGPSARAGDAMVEAGGGSEPAGAAAAAHALGLRARAGDRAAGRQHARRDAALTTAAATAVTAVTAGAAQARRARPRVRAVDTARATRLPLPTGAARAAVAAAA